MSDLGVLFVCTANVCRSPLAEALLADFGAGAGIDLTVSSASLDQQRRPIHPIVVSQLAERGLVASKSHSDPLRDDHVDRTDLILTMTGSHAIEVAGRYRRAIGRVFTLDHAVQVLPSMVGRSPAEWADLVARTPRAYPQHPGTVDVPDPIGQSDEVFRAVADQLDDLCTRLLERLFGPS